METVQLYPALAFAAGLAITLFLAAYLTPRSWWRRPNARALLIMVVGAWGLGSLILYAVDGAHAATAVPARAAAAEPPVIAADAAPIAGKPFQVHRDLNLRVTAGVDSPRLVTVPAGATVTPTGMRSGDWWQIKASVAGRDNTGWVSSLWLRRSGE
jgi:hypothetical protein